MSNQPRFTPLRPDTKYRASIHKMLLDGSIESVVHIDIPQDGLKSKRKSLEAAAFVYKYGDVSLEIPYLTPGFFRGYRYTNCAYFLHIEKSSIDELWVTDFLGYINPTGIQEVAPFGNVAISALSLDKLFGMSPEIVPRGVYQAAMVGGKLDFVRPNRPGTTIPWGEMPFIFGLAPPMVDGNSYARYNARTRLNVALEEVARPRYFSLGSVAEASLSGGESGSFPFSVTITGEPVRRTESNPEANTSVSFWSADVDLFRIGTTVYPLSGYLYGERDYPSNFLFARYEREVEGPSNQPNRENRPTLIVIEDETLASVVKNYERSEGSNAFLDCYYYDTHPTPRHRQFRFPIKKASYGDFTDQLGATHRGIGLEIDRSLGAFGLNAFWLPLDQMQYVLVVTPPVDPEGAEVRLFGNDQYGVGSGDTGPFSGEALLDSLANLVPYFKHLAPQVEWLGEAGFVPRSHNLPNRPLDALNEIQRSLGVFATFEYRSLQSNGLPGISIRVKTRDYLVSQAKVSIPVPTSWSETPSGDLPVVLVKGPAPLNVYNPGSETVAWYSEDDNGQENFTSFAKEIPEDRASVVVKLEAIETAGWAFFQGDINSYYHNNLGLRVRAKEIFEFYGRFYREATASFYDPFLQFPDLVGRVINEPHQNKDAIVMSQETNYHTRQVTLSLLMAAEDTI